MKKVWVLALLVLLPTVMFAQWRAVASVSGGLSEVDNIYMKFYNDSKAKVGYDFSATVRYAYKVFYASSGVGFQAFKAESGYAMNSSVIDYGKTRPEFSYSNIYIPVTLGFNYNAWKVYPLAEMGIQVGLPVEVKDRIVIGNEVTTKRGDPKAVVLSFVIQGGVGYIFSKKCAVEAKLRYTSSGNVSTYEDKVGKKYKSTWNYVGGQVSLVVAL